MKLSKARIREFRSIWDSNEFAIDRVACLVGKNEAGKTAILQALYRLNPITPRDGDFDVTDDYPRSEVEDYRQDVESERREDAQVVEAVFTLEATELAAVEQAFGIGVLKTPSVTLFKGYEKNSSNHSLLRFSLPVDEAVAVAHLVTTFALPGESRAIALKATSLAALQEVLTNAAAECEQAVAKAQHEANQIEEESSKAAALQLANAHAESQQSFSLREHLAQLLQTSLQSQIWHSTLQQHLPKFLYFDEYYQMRGHENVEALKQRQQQSKLNESDHPLLGLIALARLDIDQLLSAKRTQELKNKLQGASNHLSKQILKYWSQNKHLRMQFDVRPGLAEDPEGMRSGTNIWGEVYDEKHQVSTGLGTRSRGFVWFFSFLAWYSAEKQKDEPLVLLLDEPGLSLHGKAQEDLLRFFEADIVSNPKHQLIYTTHSPFMVDSRHFDRVRIVQDSGIDSDEDLPRELDGTKVLADVLDAGPDSLFPLQGALGYEIYQTLFVGPNCLVVEGVSDLLYLQVVSGALQAANRVGLDERWTITPVGGAEKVPTFVALMGSQKGLNVATLIDIQKGSQSRIDELFKRKLLKQSHVHTFAEFTGKNESDIEDMFDEDFYLTLVNREFGRQLQASVTPQDVAGAAPRILSRLNDHLARTPLKTGAFGHFRPARHLSENVGSLSIPAATLNRFEAAFQVLNALL